MAKWSDIGKAIATLAPTIAGAVGGPFVGAGVAALENALGVKTSSSDPDKQKEQLAAAFTGNADQLAAIKKAEQDFQVTMAQLGFQNAKDLEALAVQDRASARARQIAVKDWTVPFLVVAVTFGFFAMLVLCAFREIPEGSKALVFSLTGSLGTAWIAIITYFFGSSAGSAAKTDLLAKAQPIPDQPS